MIISKEEVKKAAYNNTESLIFSHNSMETRTMANRLDKAFIAGAEFLESKWNEYFIEIITENQGLKLYKDNEEKRFKELAVEFAEWILQHKNPSFGIMSGYKKPNTWMDTVQGNKIDYTTEELYELFKKENYIK